MSGDEARGNDDELLSQIDELKARMDRLMKGGTSTSNSALLTDAPKQRAPHTADPEPSPTPPPPRAPVRDLIGSDEEREIVEDLPVPLDPVPFPSESDSGDDDRPSDRPPEDRPGSSPPPSKPKPAVVDGSLIAVDEVRSEPRPTVSSFDDLGSAIEEELARDVSVPPASAKKGPDLASRFGPVDEPAPVEQTETPLVTPEPEPEDELVAEEEVVAEAVSEIQAGRSHVAALVAIWLFTAITSGTIAALHFAGII